MTSSITTRSGLELSILNAMRYCRRGDFKDPQAHETQRQVAFELYKKFDKGADDVNPNPTLAKEFLLKATGANPLPVDNFDAEAITTLLGLYTTIRLFLVRFDRFFKALNQLLHVTSSFLPRFFGFFGFSYFLEYLILAGINSYEAYQAMKFKKPEETNWAAFTRCYKNALAVNPRRSYRMDNALRWGPVNLVSTFLGPLAFAIVNIWGFYRDVTNENESQQANNIRSDRQIIDAMDRLASEKTSLENEEHSLEQEIPKLQQRASQGDNAVDADLTAKKARLSIVKDKLKDRNEHHDSLLAQRAQLSQNLLPQYKKQGLEMALVLLILAGVILYATPGLNMIAFAAGAICVLTASLFYMYNRFNQVKDFVAPTPAKKAETADLQEKDLDDTTINETALYDKIHKYLDAVEATPSPRAKEAGDDIEPTPSPTTPPSTNASLTADTTQNDGSTVFNFPSTGTGSGSPSNSLSSLSASQMTEPSEKQKAAILNIYFLYWVYCQVEHAENPDINTIFLAFTVNEINKMRLILDFSSSNDWSQQWSLWKKHKTNDFNRKEINSAQSTGPRPRYYDCSLKQTLFSKIQQENADHKAERDDDVRKIVSQLNTMARTPSPCTA